MVSRDQPVTRDAIERYRVLLDGLVDAAVIVGERLEPLAWNAAYAQAVGVPGERLEELARAPGAACHRLFELDRCRSGCLARRCFAERRFVRADHVGGASTVAREAGGGAASVREAELVVSALPLMGDDGEVAAVLEVYHDAGAEALLRERYRLLVEAGRPAADLARADVPASTLELERSIDELRAARAQLIRAEKLSSIGQLVAGIAHEINNPINYIYGNVEFLRAYVGKFLELVRALDDMVEEPEQRRRIEELKRAMEYDYLVEDTAKLLESIHSGAERATGIIRDLRSFIHGGSAQPEPVPLARCLDTTLGLVAHETRGRIGIVKRYEPVPAVLGNEGQLNQVFMNLVVNAIQAISGKGTITIALAPRDGGVAVDVTDDGVGISEADQLRIFDPFFTTKPVGEGTGLGLAISYSVVDAHGGRLTVRSAPGQGSTFTVWLPAAPADGGGARRGP